MATIDQIEMGLGNYLDNEVFAAYQDNSIVKAVMQAGVAFAIHKRKNDAVKFLSMMGAVDENGEVDVDTLAEFLKKYIPTTGSVFENKTIGKLTFQKEDVDKLCTYIKGGSTT